MAVTFDPHPMRVLRPESPLKLITPLKEKLELLRAADIDATLVLPFTRNLSEIDAEDFATSILKDRLRSDEVHEGYNFRFGRKALGDVKILQQVGRSVGFSVQLYPEMRVRNQPVSSTHIRDLLKEGDVGAARHLLGRAFSIESTITHGRGYGSKYTVPTVNLGKYDELIPKHGVYVTRTKIGDECFDSVTNVGVRPTFGDHSFAVESHLMNFHPLEVGEQPAVKIYFLKRLRDEIEFPSVEALREQIWRDIKRAQRCFRSLES